MISKDPTASESYVALRNALIAIEGDVSAVRSILSSLSDAGASWVAAAYFELRRSLVQGRITEAETVGSLIGMILDVQNQGLDDELAENRIHRESMGWVTDGIEAILAQDNRTGIKHLERLTEAVYSNDSLQWVAWYWLAKAASDEGDLERAAGAARASAELAESLDSQARGMSLCLRSEVELLQGQTDEALEHLSAATDQFERIGDRKGIAVASFTLAKLLISLGREEEGREAALKAHEVDSDWEDPAVFLSQRCLIKGSVEEASEHLTSFEDVEAPPPSVIRQRQLIDYVRQVHVPISVVADYLRLRDRPPSTELVQELERLWGEFTEFMQLRELLAWTLVKVGREEEAAQHFKAMAYLDLDAETQSSVLLGLGCLANRQYRHRQPAKRVREASSSYQPARTLEVVEEDDAEHGDEDLDIPVIEVTPPPERPAPPSAPEIPEIPVIEELPDGEDRAGTPPATEEPKKKKKSTTEFASIEEALDASFEFTDPTGTSEVPVQDALEASFEFSVGLDDEEEQPEPAGGPELPLPASQRGAAPVEPIAPVPTGEETPEEEFGAEVRIEAEPAEPGPVEAPERAAAADEPEPAAPAEEPRQARAVEPKAVFTGDLQLFAVPDLLDFLETSRRTGTLVITSQAGIGAVHLHQGRITGAASPATPNMGDLLLETGAVTGEQLTSAVQNQQDNCPDRLLGAILVEMGIVERAKLEEALVKQVKGALMEMVEWLTGRFAFEPDKRSQEETAAEIELELDTRSVLLDVLRQVDEQNR